MKYQDIQLADVSLWKQIQVAWKTGNYTTAISLIDNNQLAEKVLIAEYLNNITNEIVETEQLNDPDFNKDKITLHRQNPVGLSSGEIYFQVTNDPYTFAEVDARQLTFAGVDDLGLLWADADRGGW